MECSQNVGATGWRSVNLGLTGPTGREPANQELCAVERHNHVAMRGRSCALRARAGALLRCVRPKTWRHHTSLGLTLCLVNLPYG